MDQTEYRAMWDKLFEKSIDLITRRTQLENELNEVKAELENVEQALENLQPLAGVSDDDHVGRLGITGAIRAVLRHAKGKMSATDVRKTLTSKGFDLSGYSSPMSSIYTVLGRLTNDESGDVVKEQDENRNVFYRWKTNPDDLVQSTEITDDDIPF